jgi:hypothetical protein
MRICSWTSRSSGGLGLRWSLGGFESLGLVGGGGVGVSVGVGGVLVGLRDGGAGGCCFEGLVLGAWEGEAED